MKQYRSPYRSFIALFCAAVLWLAVPQGVQAATAPEITSMGEAINQAGRQRMLTLRMLKYYALAGQDVRARHSLEALKDAEELFESQMTRLKAFVEDDGVKRQLTEAESLWNNVKPIYASAPNREQVMTLYANNEALLAACHQIVLSLEKLSGSKTGELVNMAGRQRMLSQRIAASYALMAWGFENEMANNYEKAMSDMDSALSYLSSNPTNSSTVSSLLADARQNYKRLTRSSEAATKSVYVPGLIDRSAEKILEDINEVTKLYAQALK
jgi:nitrate/nitrite-specific signal transduction histidine kinase